MSLGHDDCTGVAVLSPLYAALRWIHIWYNDEYELNWGISYLRDEEVGNASECSMVGRCGFQFKKETDQLGSYQYN